VAVPNLTSHAVKAAHEKAGRGREASPGFHVDALGCDAIGMDR
jgi:hypothetical protein